MKKETAKFIYSDQDEFLMAYLNLFSLLYIKESDHLENREKQFFIANVKLNAWGKSLIGKEAAAYLEGELKFQARTYRSNLKKKGWLIQTKDGIILPPAFDFRLGKIPKDLTFKFKLVNGHDNQAN